MGQQSRMNKGGYRLGLDLQSCGRYRDVLCFAHAQVDAAKS